MKEHIFREYDIRGTVPQELNEESALLLGKAIGTYYRQRGAVRIALGRDCRLSSPELSEGVREGLMKTGIHVLELGMVPTPLLYFSLHHLQVDGGIQITGSHNPPEFNGLKICLGQTSIYGKEIQKIREIVDQGRFHQAEGGTEQKEVITPYIQYVKDNIRPGPVERRIILDCGNGASGPVAPKLYEGLGVGVETLFCDPDGRFPNHHPDPTIPEYLDALISRVRESGANLGIAFDGDADRIGVVDEQGEIIWGDQLMVLFSRDLLERHPGAKIIGEVKCSQVLFDDIERHGGQAIMWKAGHSLIKSKMKEEGALLAGEMSGHLFFGERYYGYDDAIYAGARLLEIVTKTERSLHELLSDVPKMKNTPEIRIDCPDEKKFRVVASLAEEFKRN